MKQLCGLAIALMIMSGCRVLDKPRQSFDRAAVPAPPDYSHYDHWSAHSFKADMADTVPDGYNLVNRQNTAAVDVFFIHPTTYKQSGWNAPLHDERTIAPFLTVKPGKKLACPGILLSEIRKSMRITHIFVTPNC